MGAAAASAVDGGLHQSGAQAIAATAADLFWDGLSHAQKALVESLAADADGVGDRLRGQRKAERKRCFATEEEVRAWLEKQGMPLVSVKPHARGVQLVMLASLAAPTAATTGAAAAAPVTAGDAAAVHGAAVEAAAQRGRAAAAALTRCTRAQAEVVAAMELLVNPVAQRRRHERHQERGCTSLQDCRAADASVHKQLQEILARLRPQAAPARHTPDRAPADDPESDNAGGSDAAGRGAGGSGSESDSDAEDGSGSEDDGSDFDEDGDGEEALQGNAANAGDASWAAASGSEPAELVLLHKMQAVLAACGDDYDKADAHTMDIATEALPLFSGSFSSIDRLWTIVSMRRAALASVSAYLRGCGLRPPWPMLGHHGAAACAHRGRGLATAGQRFVPLAVMVALQRFGRLRRFAFCTARRLS
jgi:hypothetical protein